MSTCCSRVSNNFWWVVGRAREIKLREIPYFLLHPSLIISLIYRQRVKDAMVNSVSKKMSVKLSMIVPSHPIKGNWVAENKCRERVFILKENKDLLLSGNTVSQKFILKLMPSSAPIQCVYDKKRFITFQGTGRIFALKECFEKEDPTIEITVYNVSPALFRKAITPMLFFSLDAP